MAIGRASGSCSDTIRVAPSGCRRRAGRGSGRRSARPGRRCVRDRPATPGSARRSLASLAQAAAGVGGDVAGVGDAAAAMPAISRVDRLHLGLGVVAAAAQPRPDVMGPAAHRTGPVPGGGARRQPGRLDLRGQLGQPGDALGQQPRVRRVGDVGLHHRGVGPHPVQADQLVLVRLGQQRLVQPVDRRLPQRVVIFINVVGCGTLVPSGTRQNRRHARLSATSRHNGSKPSR